MTIERTRRMGEEKRKKSQVRALPRPLGPYLLLEELATGGMARVFRAWKLPDGPAVALKQLLGRHAEKPAVVRRFSREAVVSSMLDHPNVARVLDAGLDRGSAWIAMELVDGETIADLMKESILAEAFIPQEIAVAIMLAMLDGLAYVHDARGKNGEPLELVHRDLSPRNVMIGYDGVVKIIDFGVARAEVGDFQTKPGHLLGSLRYLSPEQAMGMQVDRTSDLYTAGVIAYEMLTLEPYVKEDHPLKVLHAIVQRPVRPDSDLAGVAPAVRAVVRRALAKKADDRFQNASDMRAALVEALAKDNIAAAGREEVAAFVRELFERADSDDALQTKSETLSDSDSELLSVWTSKSSSSSEEGGSDDDDEAEAETGPAHTSVDDVDDDAGDPPELTRSTMRVRIVKTAKTVQRAIKRRRGVPATMLLALIVAAGGLLVYAAQPSAVPVVLEDDPPATAVPAVKARTAPKEPEPQPLRELVVEPEPDPPIRTKRAPRTTVQPAVAPDQPYAALHRLVAEAQSDPRRFDAAYDAIRAASDQSTVEDRVRVRVHAALNASRIAGDPAGLSQALRTLEDGK